jgi:O-antigen/teichoic acid export membrane protein
VPIKKFEINILANFLGQGWAAIMAIAFLPVYINYLGLEAYGLIGFFAVMQSFVVVFDLGMAQTLTREAARYKAGNYIPQSLCKLVRSFECIGTATATVLALGVIYFSDDLANRWVKASSLSPQVLITCIAIMGFVFAMRLLEGIYRGILIGLDRQVLYNILSACVATARYAGAIAVLQHGSATVEAFFKWQGVVSVLSLLTLAIAAYLSLPKSVRRSRFSLSALRSVWRFSLGVTITSILSLAIVNLDKLVLSGLITLEQLGIYMLASTAAGVLYTLVTPITQGAYPRMVALVAVKRQADLAALHHTSSQLISVVVGTAAVILGVYSQEIIYVWSGNFALASTTSPILSVLTLAALANCYTYVGHNMQLVYGSTRVLVFINTAILVTICIAFPLIVTRYGLLGASYGWLIVSSLQMVVTLTWAHMRCLPGEWVSWLTCDVFAPLGGASATAALLYLCRPDTTVGRVGVLIFIFLVASASVIVAIACAPKIRGRLIGMLIKPKVSVC